MLLATGAIAWSLLAVAGAFTIPAYSTEYATDSGQGTGSATLVEMNGLLPVGYMLALGGLAALCWIGLHRRCAVGSRVGTVLAWVATMAALLLTLISVIGVFMLPMVAMMAVALGMTRKGAPAQRA